jgi:hypothetical protein
MTLFPARFVDDAEVAEDVEEEVDDKEELVDSIAQPLLHSATTSAALSVVDV